MVTLLLSLGAVELGSFPNEAAVLLTLIALFIARDVFGGWPSESAAAEGGRAFSLAALPLALLFAVIVALRFARG